MGRGRLWAWHRLCRTVGREARAGVLHQHPCPAPSRGSSTATAIGAPLPCRRPLWPSGRSCTPEVAAPGVSGGGGEVSRDSNVCFLCNFKRVVDLDAEVPDRALDLGMAKQELYSTQIPRSPIDEGCFCAAHRMRSILQRVEANAADPL